MRHSIVLIAGFFLCSCTHLINPASDIKFLTGPMVQSAFQWDLIDTKGLSASERVFEENRIYTAIEAACVVPYHEQRADILRELFYHLQRNNFSTADQSPLTAEFIDLKLTECLAAYGVKGHFIVAVPGWEEMDLPGYLALLISKGRALVAWQNRGAPFLLSNHGYPALPGSAYWVDQYIKRDGTIVRGHLRSSPNNTCIDNIRGCR